MKVTAHSRSSDIRWKLYSAAIKAITRLNRRFDPPMHHLAPMPADETHTLLVHGQCECGWRCACPEGWIWPHCPLCGLHVKPKRGQPHTNGLPNGYGNSKGYFAKVLPEGEAAALARNARHHPEPDVPGTGPFGF